MPRVYPPKKNNSSNSSNEKEKSKSGKTKPNMISNKGGCEVNHMKINGCLNINDFEICVSEDGTELQIWKGETLVKSFK